MKRHFNYPERSEWMRHALAVCVNCEYQLHTYMHWHMRSIGNRTIGSRCAHIATDEMADTCFSSGRHGATHVSKTIALIHWVSFANRLECAIEAERVANDSPRHPIECYWTTISSWCWNRPEIAVTNEAHSIEFNELQFKAVVQSAG